MITHIGNKNESVYRIHNCKTCNNVVYVHMDKETYEKVINRDEPIQNIIPNSDVVTREYFITGMCKICQDDMFKNDEYI